MERPRKVSRLSIHEFHIHVSKKIIPDMEEIMSFRKVCKNWLFTHPPPLVVSGTDWRHQIMSFGFGETKIRKQGNYPISSSPQIVVDTKNRITWSSEQRSSKRENGKTCGNRSRNSKLKRATLNRRRNYPPITKCGNQNISINMGRYLGRLKYSQTIPNQQMTQDMLNTSVSYSLTQVQTMTVHRKWEMTCLNTGLLKLR